jgi:hypothetical protein
MQLLAASGNVAANVYAAFGDKIFFRNFIFEYWARRFGPVAAYLSRPWVNYCSLEIEFSGCVDCLLSGLIGSPPKSSWKADDF